MWSRKRISVSFTPRKLRKPSLLLKRRTPTANKPSSNVKVIVRVRPQNEKDSTCRPIIKVVDDQCLIFDPKEGGEEFYVGGHKQLNRDMLKKRHKNIEFQFDRVFDEETSNWDVFAGTTQNLIESLIDGYNCSVFVYGATGAGKTYTMLGSKETPGIAYLTMVELYKQMKEEEVESKFDLSISYVEVYNETVKDLISPSGPLNLRDDGKDGIIISGIKTHRIESVDELYQMLERGNKNRTQHPTDANAESSRSHAVFQVHLSITEKISLETKYSKLTMIDLAGSERGGVTGGKGARFSEGSNINKSLLALGNCVDALAEGQKHIPYRNSKLTRILKDSLGGNCKTVMIVNVAPTNYAYEETFNTLNYANRAKKINNKIRRNLCNVDLPPCQYRKIIEELKLRNVTLEEENRMLKGGGSLPQNKCNSLSGVSEETPARTSDAEKGREVLRCLYELEGKYKKDILMYQMKIKTLDWRIYQKKVIAERFDMFEYIVGDQKIRTKMDEAAHRLKLQKDTFREKVRCLQKSLKVKQVQREMALKEIQETGLQNILQGDIDHYNNKMSQECSSLQINYYKDLLAKQQNEMSSCDKIINLLCKNMDYFYSILCGIGRISDLMKEEYLQLVQQLAGVKGVSWQDEACDYNILRKIIDLSYASDVSHESPVNVPCSIDNSEPSTKCLPTVSPVKVSVDEHVEKKIASLGVINESLNNLSSPVPNINPILPIAATPSIGLQCIAEYLSPVDELIITKAENSPSAEKCSMPVCFVTPISDDKLLNGTYAPLSPINSDNSKVEINIVPFPPDAPLKFSFDRTFSVPELSPDKSNLSFEKSSIQKLDSIFVSSPQEKNSEEDKLVGGGLKDSIPLNTTFVSNSSETETKCDSFKAVDESMHEEEELPLLDSVCYSMPMLTVCEEVADKVGVSENNFIRILNTTFNSNASLEEKVHNSNDGNNASPGDCESVSKLNTTFTSSPVVIDECSSGNVPSILRSKCDNLGSELHTPPMKNIHKDAKVVSETNISVLPKISSKISSGTVISPARKAVSSSNSKIIQPTKSVLPTSKNESVSVYTPSFGSNSKSRVVLERNQTSSSKDNRQVQLSSNPKVKPSGSIKIHFNPLTDKNKLASVSGKGIVGKISSSDSLKSKKPTMRIAVSSTLKENKIPTQTKLLVPRSLSKNSEVKMNQVPVYLAKKPVDGNVRRFESALFKTTVPP